MGNFNGAAPRVAILLATYNGAKFLQNQITSLAANTARFTLHWLDDFSDDDSRQIVRTTSHRLGIELAEHYMLTRQGLPCSFFSLLDQVDADIYMFCDQDDIWEAGKIDTMVAALKPLLNQCALCYSESILFYENSPLPTRRLYDLVGKKKVLRALARPLIFHMFARAIAPGHTQAFTRPLRELYLAHAKIARAYAFMHDWWMYDIAVVSGHASMLPNVPTAFWRQHDETFSGHFFRRQERFVAKQWHTTQATRRAMARHARGFLLAAHTLPEGANLLRLRRLAQLLVRIDRPQTPLALIRLASIGARPHSWTEAVWFYTACLCTSAGPDDHRSAPSDT